MNMLFRNILNNIKQKIPISYTIHQIKDKYTNEETIEYNLFLNSWYKFPI